MWAADPEQVAAVMKKPYISIQKWTVKACKLSSRVQFDAVLNHWWLNADKQRKHLLMHIESETLESHLWEYFLQCLAWIWASVCNTQPLLAGAVLPVLLFDCLPLCYILTSSSFLQLTSLELQYVSPKLLMCRDLELAVPGTYDPNQPIIRIQSIAPSLQVITSKQRPRKLTIMGKIRRKLRRPCGSEPIRLGKQMKEYQ